MQPEIASRRALPDVGLNDSAAPPPNPAARWLVRAVCLLAGAIGLYYGYGIGSRVSGMWMGVVMALNCAVIAALLAGAVVERLRRVWGGLRQGR